MSKNKTPKASKTVASRKAIGGHDSATSVAPESETKTAAAPEEEKDWSSHIGEEKTDFFKHPVTLGSGENKKTVYISDEYARTLVATEEAKAARKEVRSTNGALRKQTKADAAKKRADFQRTLVEHSAILAQHGITLNPSSLSQPIFVKKGSMTIRGVTFKSPIGMGGARYYINHSVKKNPKVADPIYLNNLLTFGQLVSLAASQAAQAAGLEAMKKLAPAYGIDLAGLEIDDEDEGEGEE